jgi:hypothetical protein
VCFTADDADLVASFGPRAAPHFPRIASEFYDRMRAHDDARRVLGGDSSADRRGVVSDAWSGYLRSNDDALILVDR